MTDPHDVDPIESDRVLRPRADELGDLLEEVRSARRSWPAIRALSALAEWARTDDATGAQDATHGALERSTRWRRCTRLVHVLETDTAARSAVRDAIALVVGNGEGLALFAEAGLGTDRGLWHELADRLYAHFLPAPRGENDLARCVERIFPRSDGTAWIAEMPPQLFERLVRALDLDASTLGRLRERVEEALVLLAIRAQALGFHEALRARREDRSVAGSPWHGLPRATEDLVASLRAERAKDGVLIASDDALVRWRSLVASCRTSDGAVLAKLERTGISLDLVYALDLSSRMTARMELLVAALIRASRAPDERSALHELVVELAGAAEADGSLRLLARDTSRLLARRVIERAGETGEHYIATTRREYARLWLSAAIGGLVTTSTAAIKLAVSAWKIAPFAIGLASSVNYALSFLVIQACGGTLATKQPAMTAANLAVVLKKRGAGEFDDLAAHVARIVRSQLAATIGNVLAIAAGAWALDHAWRALRGTPFLDPEHAEHALHALDPLSTLTLLYAAETGVLLWLSSVLSGAIENWTIYHRLPQVIAEHEWSERLGRARMQRIGAFVERKTAMIANCVVLGFLLGMTPLVGAFFGLPLDVRHVTLSSGQLALGAVGLDAGLRDPLVIRAIAGIAVIFVLNLAVSFALALSVAVAARGVHARQKRALGLAVLRHLARHPLDFVRPPRDAVEPSVTASNSPPA